MAARPADERLRFGRQGEPITLTFTSAGITDDSATQRRSDQTAHASAAQTEDFEVPQLYPCLWFDGRGEEAANFYVSLLPNSRIDQVWRTPADTPAGPEGTVLTVDFTLAGQHIQALNGGPEFTFSEAISLVIECEDQAEVDRLWNALTADGGEPGPCGWLKDRFGLSWQITPRRLNELVSHPDREGARRAMQAMLKMGKIETAELERAFRGEA